MLWRVAQNLLEKPFNVFSQPIQKTYIAANMNFREYGPINFASDRAWSYLCSLFSLFHYFLVVNSKRRGFD